MNREILILNSELSGLNEYLFVELEKKGWDLTCINIPFPRICRYLAMASAFTPNLRKWKRQFYAKLEKLYKIPWVFIQRSRYAQRRIKKLRKRFDLILQISGMFSPYTDYTKIPIPYINFTDYTMALSTKYSPWLTAQNRLNKWLKLERELYKNASLVFTSNENARQSIINDYDISDKKVIKAGCGLCLDSIPEYQKNYDGKTILFIGIDFERKGGFVLLDAFKKVKEAILDAKLIIAGPPKNRYSIKQDSVDFLGLVKDRKVIEELYQRASIFVMPSLCEPFGLVYLEAMAYQLPCIGTNIDAVNEIILDGKTGFLVNPRDVSGLADKIIRLLSNIPLMEEMGLAGRNHLKENFRWESVAEKIASSIEK